MFFASIIRKNQLILTSLLIAAPAMAVSEIDMLTEDDLLVEIPVVSSVTHMEQTLPQTPASVTIIDRQTIQASTAVDITDLFRLVPGFQTYYVNGGRSGVTYHALGDEYPRRLEVKVDGRSVYESLFSAVTWSTIGIDLDDIEYIEVVRGANAAADGSNAFLASINIVTRSPLLDTGLSFRSQIGSAQTRNAALSFSGRIGDVNHRTTLSVRGNDGFDDGITVAGVPVSVDDDSEAVSFTSKGLWTPSSSDNVEFQIGATKSDVGMGEFDYMNRELSYQYQYFNWTHLNTQGNKIQLIAYHNSLDLEDDVQPREISEVLRDDFGLDLSSGWPLPFPDKTIFNGSNRSKSKRLDVELRNTLVPGDNVRAVTGIAVRYDKVSSQTLFDTLDDISETSYRTYANLEWTQSENLIFNGGIIVEDRDSTGTYASYRLAENYLLSEDHIIRVALNRSFRAPTLLEDNQKGFVRYIRDDECSPDSTSPECNPLFRDIILDAGGVSAKDIRNEELKSYEIGYSGYFLNRNLSLDVRAFHEKMSNVISERRDVTQDPAKVDTNFNDLDNFVNIRDNTDDLEVRGVEIQAIYKPNDRFLLRGHYSYSDIDGITCYGSPVEAGQPCSEYRDLDEYSLKDTLGVMASYRFAGGLRLGTTVSYNSAVKHYRGQYNDSLKRIDLKAAKTWDINRSSIDVSLTVQNVGEAYKEFYVHNLFETRYILGFKINLP
jgi:iron complex outermembrane receptor protein